MSGQSRTIRVAAGQVTARPMNEAEVTLASLQATIASAAGQKADLLVLPECAYPAYLLGSTSAYRSGTHLSSTAFVDWLADQAARHGLYVVSGFVEDDGERLYNAAVLIDDRGREIGRSRKTFLWHADRDWFIPGDDIRPLDTPLGRIGIAICADTRVPEILATLLADGAELIAMPTCWVNGARTPGQFQNPQVSFLIEARAREFDVPFVCADKTGLEMPGVGYVGLSRIVAADGTLLAEAPPTGEAVIAAELPLRRPRPLHVESRLRDRLLSAQTPRRPSADGPRKVTLAAVPQAAFRERLARDLGRQWWQYLREKGIEVVAAQAADEASVPQVAQLASGFGITWLGTGDPSPASLPAQARIGRIPDGKVQSFADARVLALDGADLLVCFDAGEDQDLAVLCTRAAENRVFLAAAGERSAAIIGPDGQVLARSGTDNRSEAVAEIDLAAASDKLVAPRTDVFDQRPVEVFRF